MDSESLEMLLDSASVSSVSLADPALEEIASRGPSSIDLDEQLEEIVANTTEDMPNSRKVIPDDDCHSCESVTLGDEAEPYGDLGANFGWSESDNEDDQDPLAGMMDEEEEEEDDEDDLAQCCTDTPPALLELVQILLLWSTIYKVSDNAMSILFKSLRVGLGKFATSECIAKAATMLPKTVKGCMKLLQATTNNAKLPEPKGMVVCPKCFSVHDLEWQGHIPSYRKCVHRPSPNHPQRTRRAACQAELFSETSAGNLVPEKVFPYIPLEVPLHNILSRPGILESCSAWKSRVSTVSGDERLLRDIYDGNVIHEQAVQSDMTGTLPVFLALNVDWFQPFTHTQYSVGAMYLSIANLPRESRFRIENMVLVGVIPGPNEPRLHINSFLTSFIEELRSFASGITMIINGTVVKVRALLNLIICDIPGCRKVLALPGHSARLGCSKCLREFEVNGFTDKPDYSGYDRSHWPPRCRDDHYAVAKVYAAASTKTEQKRIASQYGVRYCALMELPYFDLIRHHVIDPMHNLFEGSAKRFMMLLTMHNILDMAKIEKRVSMVIPPTPTGRIPQKVEAKFSGFTADQWRSWVLLYSPIVLLDIDSTLYACWMNFVRACQLLSSRAITVANVDEADRYLTDFCSGLQAYFGPEVCTINMHMHLHLRQCLLDYGPIYGFWCFPYERYNGKLGDYATNRKGIEMQIAKKFLREHFLRSLPVPGDYRDLLSVDPNTGFNAAPLNTAGPTAVTTSQHWQINHCQTVVCPVREVCFSLSNGAGCIELGVATIKVLRTDELRGLQCMYDLLYGNTFTADTIFTSHFAECSSSVNFGGVTVKKGQMVSAHWPPDNPLLPERCGTIHGFFVHEVQLSGAVQLQHILAEVHWYELLPHSHNITPLIAAMHTVDIRLCQFLPVQRLKGYCAHATLNLPQLHAGEVLIANPISFNYTVC